MQNKLDFLFINKTMNKYYNFINILSIFKEPVNFKQNSMEKENSLNNK